MLLICIFPWSLGLAITTNLRKTARRLADGAYPSSDTEALPLLAKAVGTTREAAGPLGVVLLGLLAVVKQESSS